MRPFLMSGFSRALQATPGATSSIFLQILAVFAVWGSVALAQQSSTVLPVGAIFDQNDTAVSSAFEAALKSVSQRTGLQMEPRISRVRSSAEAEKTACDLLAEGVVALVTDAAPAVTRTAARVADKAEVPHLSVAEAAAPLASFSLSLWPKPDQIYRAAQRELGGWNKDRLAFITNRPRSAATIKQIKKIFGDETLFFSAKTSLVFALANAKAIGLKTFLVELQGTDVEAVLNSVRTLNMAGAEFAYFLFAPDTVGLRRSPLDARMRAKVQFLSLVPFLGGEEAAGPSAELQKVLKTDRIPIKAALIYDAVQLLSKGLMHIMGSTRIAPKRLSCSGSQKFPQGLVVLQTMRTGLREGLGLTGPVTYEDASDRTNLKLRVVDISKGNEALRRRPLRQANSAKGKKLRVVTLVENLFVTKSTKDGVTTYDGFAVALLKLLAEDAGFTYTIYETPDGFYGAKNSSNLWNGMIGELAYRKADIAIGPITISYERERVVEFTTPFMQVTTNMLALKAKKQRINPFAFFQPLSASVWITLIISYVIVSFVLFFVARLSPYEWHKPHDGATYRVNKFDLRSAFWFAIAGCLRQYPGIAPRSTAARVIAGFWWIVVLLVFLFYAVNLAPFLQEQRMVNPISTFADLAQQSKVQPGTLSNGSTMAFFKRSNLETYMTIYEKMKAFPSSFKNNYADGIDAVLKSSNGDFIFIGEKPLLAKAAQKNCQLQVLQEGIDSKGYGFGLQQNSQYRKTINSALLKLQKNQKLAEIERRYLRNKGLCGDSSSNPDGAVVVMSLSNMFGVFLLLIPGVLIGLLCLVGESFAKRRCGPEDESLPMSDFRQSLTMSTKRTVVETEAAAPAEAEA